MVELWVLIAVVIAAVIVGFVMFIAGFTYRKKTGEKQIGSARDEAKRIINDALKTAETSFFRNNVRMMRMVFRYSDLEANNPRLDVKVGVETNASDENGELWYMAENFDSFISGKEGYGIATPAFKRNDVDFKPDYWYEFE